MAAAAAWCWRRTGPALFAGSAYVAGQMLFRVGDQTLPRALSALPEKTPVA